MTRDYRSMIRPGGVWIPRWALYLGIALFALWFGARIFIPPTWLVQQLDAPDGTRSARLYRRVYLEHHFIVKIQEGWYWQTAYYSPPLPRDFRIDLNERLRWSADSRRLWLRVEDERVWGYDFERQRAMGTNELQTFEEKK